MQKNKKYLLTMLTFAFVIACTFFFQKDVKAAEKTGYGALRHLVLRTNQVLFSGGGEKH